jgi:hypothetical protein
LILLVLLWSNGRRGDLEFIFSGLVDWVFFLCVWMKKRERRKEEERVWEKERRSGAGRGEKERRNSAGRRHCGSRRPGCRLLQFFFFVFWIFLVLIGCSCSVLIFCIFVKWMTCHMIIGCCKWATLQKLRTVGALF